jgi:myxalamid-type polyketide synthase MxaE and MxaD
MGTRLSSPIPSFELECSADTDEWLTETRYDGAALMSTATLATIAAEVGREQIGACTVDGLTIAEPAPVPADGTLVLQTVVSRQTPDGGSFAIYRRRGADDATAWDLCASGDFHPAVSGSLTGESLADARARCRTPHDAADVYRALAARGVDVREDARTLREVFSSASRRLARVEPGAIGDRSVARLLEACLHLMATADRDAPQFIRVPERIGRITLPSSLGESAWVLVICDERASAASCVLFDSEGRACGQLEEVALRRVRASAFAGSHRTRTAAWGYDLVWEPAALDRPDVDPLVRTFVVLGADTAIGSALADQIDASGGSAVRVSAGARFHSTRRGHFEIDPRSAADYVRVLHEASLDAAAPVAGFVHIWGLESDAPTLEAVESRARSNALSVLYSVHALEASTEAGLRLWIVTRGAQATARGEAPQVSQATAWGIGRVLALEEPRLFAGALDLDPAAIDAVNAEAAASFIGSRGEPQLASRNGAWLAPRLVAAARAEASGAFRLRSDGTYLVTGGLGRLGLQIASWLAENGAGRLVLVGRRGLPPRQDWRDLPERSDAARQVRMIAAIEALGTEVTVIAADVADASAMGDLFSRFGRTLPPLRGIVHAAGRIDYRPVGQVGPAEIDDVCRAKVRGAWLLHELTRDGRHPLEFFVLFSSGASVWGSRHLAHYAAANHVLDAIAHARRARGLPATAINWGWWDGGATSADAEALFAQAGLRAMPGEDALQAMGDVLRADVPQRMVAAIDWKKFKPSYESTGARLLEHIETSVEIAPTSRARGALRREAAALEPREAAVRIHEHVRAEVAAVIGRDPAQLDPARGFFKLGMDSLMSVELRRRLEAAIDAPLPTTIAFEYPTINALSQFLAKQMVVPPLEAVPPAATSDAAASDASATMLDEHSDEELASMLDGEIARLLGGQEGTQ